MGIKILLGCAFLLLVFYAAVYTFAPEKPKEICLFLLSNEMGSYTQGTMILKEFVAVPQTLCLKAGIVEEDEIELQVVKDEE